MRLSDFWQLVSDEFGEAYGRVLVRDLALTGLAGSTGAQALGAGVGARDVWLALCVAMDVPKNRWHGLTLAEKKRAGHAD
ncbi:DUF3046 domain-containing protein [Homoserinimonas sp. OAct 916]|uniref:DUF3046 domain-containing protein n=1 Tax=Homoserinimonas sp. OAct 916 TaxID=2211450 RepID=UPI000DBE59D5|nr:DUF3046 domain-containing protein [Homoserinimonas sp. OAct 916]